MRLILLLFIFLLSANAHKILMYSIKYGYSHMNYIGSIADTLQAAGHNMTVIQPEVDKTIKGTGCQLANVISVPSDDYTAQVLQERKDYDKGSDIWTMDISDPSIVSGKGPSVAKIYSAAMKNVLKQTQLMENLRNEKFDLGIFELLDYAGYPVLYEAGITNVVGCLSVVLGDRVASNLGIPSAFSYVPALQSSSSDDGSFHSRIWNLAFAYFSSEYERIVETSAQDYMDEHHPNAPKVWEVVSNMPVIFTNSEPLIDFPRPTLHKVVDLGGIGLKTAAALDEDWLAVLSKRAANVLISFGSMAQSSAMPLQYKESFMATAKEFPNVTFIWKYETPEDGIASGIDNLYLSKWTPQTDLLASGKIDLFISHGGAGSVMESTTAGVPMITIPLFGDQYRNAMMAQRFGHAVFIAKENLYTKNFLERVVKEALNNKIMKEKARLARQMLENRPFTPQEKLLKHIDMVIRFGGNLTSLSPSGRNFSFVQFYNLDIFALAIVIFAAVSWVFICCFKMLLRFIQTDEKQKLQ